LHRLDKGEEPLGVAAAGFMQTGCPSCNKSLKKIIIITTTIQINRFQLIPGGAKKRPEHLQVLYSSVIDRFLKFIHCYIQW